MNHSLARYQRLVARTEPRTLEVTLRGLLIALYYHLSDKQVVRIKINDPQVPCFINLLTPTLFKGAGQMILAPDTVFGVVRSPGSLDCSYVDARTNASQIHIGGATTINNRASIISEGASITIGSRCLIGPEVMITDSNNHELAVTRRNIPDQGPLPVVIGNDVFVGARVIILKGCNIGDGCVIAAGSVLPPLFQAPPYRIIGGNPARLVGTVETDPDSNLVHAEDISHHTAS